MHHAIRLTIALLCTSSLLAPLPSWAISTTAILHWPQLQITLTDLDPADGVMPLISAVTHAERAMTCVPYATPFCTHKSAHNWTDVLTQTFVGGFGDSGEAVANENVLQSSVTANGGFEVFSERWGDFVVSGPARVSVSIPYTLMVQDSQRYAPTSLVALTLTGPSIAKDSAIHVRLATGIEQGLITDSIDVHDKTQLIHLSALAMAGVPEPDQIILLLSGLAVVSGYLRNHHARPKGDGARQ